MKLPDVLPLSAIEPSPTNPRKRFDADKLAHLAATMSAQGVLQKLLVRPAPGKPGVYEIVDGERRWRAAGQIGLQSLPVEIKDLSDGAVIEVQLIAGETGEPLTPIEEAQALKRALSVQENGKPLYTVATLAAKIGYTAQHVYGLLSLLKLPTAVQAALEKGEMDHSVGRLIARIPSEADRTKAAVEIMPSATRPEPMTHRQAEAWIRERYTVSLAQAPYSLEDELLPGPRGSAQACVGCEYLDADPRGGPRTCSNPACYRQKCNAVWDRRVTKAKGEGQRVLTDEEAEQVFEKHSPVPQIAYDSPYVDVNSKPTYRHVANEVEDAKLPKWRDLLETAEREKDIKVPIVLARDRNGKQWELVQLSLAIDASRAVGEDIFKKTPASESLSSKDRFDRDAVRSTIRGTDDFEAKKKAEAKANKKRQQENVAALRALREYTWDLNAEPVLDALLLVALAHAGPEGVELCGLMIQDKCRSGESMRDVVGEHFAEFTPEAKRAMLIALFASRDMRWQGTKAEGYANLAACAMNSAIALAPAEFQGGDFCYLEDPENYTCRVRCQVIDPADEDILEAYGLKKAETKVFCATGAQRGLVAVMVQATTDLQDAVSTSRERKHGRGAELKLVAPGMLKHERYEQDEPRAEEKPSQSKAKAKRVVITDEIRSEVRRLVESGRTGLEIAKEVGISLPSVQNIKKALGFVKERAEKRQKLNEDLRAKIVEKFKARGITRKDGMNRVITVATSGRAQTLEEITTEADGQKVLALLDAHSKQFKSPEAGGEENAA